MHFKEVSGIASDGCGIGLWCDTVIEDRDSAKANGCDRG